MFDTPSRKSQDNIYTALRTIDLTGFVENVCQSPVWATPVKQQLSPSISYASPSIPYSSPSIPYASPSWHRSLQTPTRDQSTYGII